MRKLQIGEKTGVGTGGLESQEGNTFGQSSLSLPPQVSPTILFCSPNCHREPHQIHLSKIKTLESSTSPLPADSQFDLRNLHSCFSTPTATVLPQLHRSLAWSPNYPLTHPVYSPCAARVFSPALHLHWLPIMSFWDKVQVLEAFHIPALLPQAHRTSSHSPNALVLQAVLPGLCSLCPLCLVCLLVPILEARLEPLLL